ncbi:MAG: glycoside hydrolase [Gemmatimonadetes bacterium]|nr:glycoside hydrolase [Gemmatimonadota bacterium]
MATPARTDSLLKENDMRFPLPHIAIAFAGISLSAAAPQERSFDAASAMHWRQIGPPRAGRGRALSGVATQPNTFYIGFDNGGVWRSTDYGNNWEPLFDKESTGSIGAIAVAPSNPKTIYVGTGAGIIRPDLATGNGIYKSIDEGKTWTRLGLFDSQMIAMIDVDPRDENRLFVAVLGHPYGPNAERGIFRSVDGGKSFQKVLYKDEYTSANDVRIDPSNPNTIYASLWQQQQAFWEGGAFGSGGNGIYKSTDGGSTWKQLTEGLPSVQQANIAVAPSNPNLLYAVVAPATGAVGFYKSEDGGEHWKLAVAGANGTNVRAPDNRPMNRIGGGDLPTIVVDGKNPAVVYSASTVMWRTEDGGLNWSAVRGAPGGDDYQRVWVNPNNPDILLVISDQGGVVSANRGKSWSNWYNQPTAAMYHVTTDNAFLYRVCSGQQDSGSACVDSRSMDGEITFHDWHPVGIQEYGVAAPDPRDPDMVFGSARTNVSIYNRKTAQKTNVGPDLSVRGPKGENYGRNVRTMPIQWSPVDPSMLVYASNAIWKTMDKGKSWTRISGDLAKQTWTAPASAGKYASTVTPSPLGAITGLSLSPRDVKVIWAGTDDGNVQVTMDGGAKWSDVTPAGIKPWTRMFNIDAGHFDTQTAYVAANTMRIDDRSPHFWRTHDGGKTWTEINTGITGPGESNAIREDPRVKGLLYAATETQVWVSYDDGDHWQSLRLNMPAISVRDIQVKDDSTCLCSDLVAGTHGRGFWILDNLTPLRQQAALKAAESARSAYLVKPATAVRVRHGTNDPTPWPPELPAGENPMPGAILDYFLPANASGEVLIEVLDRARKVVRSYSSKDAMLDPHPAVDMVAYDKICRARPTATFCGLPLYWPGRPIGVATTAGMHRFSWDMHLEPFEIEDIENSGDEGATGAVPHNTYDEPNAPWAAAGNYTVRLTVEGKTYTQPITLRLDPRVKTSAVGMQQLALLSREMWDASWAAHEAFESARKFSTELGKLSGADVAAFKAKVDSLAPAPAAGGRGGRGGGFGGRGGAPAGPLTLDRASTAFMAAAMGMQGADVAPTDRQVATVAAARTQGAPVTAKWKALSTIGLAAVNAKRKAAGDAAIVIPK